MAAALTQFTTTAAVIVAAGVFLTRSADAIAQLTALNLLMVFPLAMAHPDPLLSTLEPIHALTCFAVILISAIVILGQLYRVERRIVFIEPDAGLVILLVVGTLWLIYLVE